MEEELRKTLRSAYLGGSHYKVKIVAKDAAEYSGSIAHLGFDHVILHAVPDEVYVILDHEIESVEALS